MSLLRFSLRLRLWCVLALFGPASLVISQPTQPQEITIYAPAKIRVGASAYADAYADSGLPVTLSIVSGTELASLANGAITALKTGFVVLRATQEGDADYLPACRAEGTHPFRCSERGGGRVGGQRGPHAPAFPQRRPRRPAPLLG